MTLAHHDLLAAREAVASGRTSAAAEVERNLTAARLPDCARAFIRRFDDQARAVAEAVDRQLRSGAPLPPLAGLAVSIKDLFDVAGQPTTAGSATLAQAPAAAADCPAVARLRGAGAALVGHTNLSEFAFSGVGLNPHFGTPVNAGAAAVDPVERVPGGSTSGGATSVAAGAAWAALGSDTGGSIRIPAALQGLVGFKNTQRLTPLEGCIPLSASLDTSCAITRSVGDAIVLHRVLSARHVEIERRPHRLLRLAVPTNLMLADLDAEVATAFHGTLDGLRRAGAMVDEIDLPPLDRLAAATANGGFAAAESWAWHRHRMAEHGAGYDPRVALRIRRGQAISAADYIELQHFRRAWRLEIQAAISGYDALLSPTVPCVAPPLAGLAQDDDAFFSVNARLLRNPAVVNFLDGCALSIPCQDPGRLPVGLMLWGPALADDRVLAAGLAVESLLNRRTR